MSTTSSEFHVAVHCAQHTCCLLQGALSALLTMSGKSADAADLGPPLRPRRPVPSRIRLLTSLHRPSNRRNGGSSRSTRSRRMLAARFGSPRHVETVDSRKRFHRPNRVLVVGPTVEVRVEDLPVGPEPPGSTIVTLMPRGFISGVQHLGERKSKFAVWYAPNPGEPPTRPPIDRIVGNGPNAVGGIREGRLSR